jgi:hypothetical protein
MLIIELPGLVRWVGTGPDTPGVSLKAIKRREGERLIGSLLWSEKSQVVLMARSTMGRLSASAVPRSLR